MLARTPPDDDPCAIVEIRQYTLVPGRRDALIELFDRTLVDGQTTDGMTVIGQFRTPDDPNRFFWVRGFRNMETRRKALAAFYGGELWKQHSAAANGTMVDSDNALLVRPARPHSGLPFMADPGRDAPQPSGLLVATIYHPEAPVTDELATLFDEGIRPIVTRAGARVIGTYVTENGANDFPALPVRNVQSLAWFACFGDDAAYDRYRDTVASDPAWAAVRQRFAELKNYAPPEVWRLQPTSRSRLRC